MGRVSKEIGISDERELRSTVSVFLSSFVFLGEIIK